MRTFARRQDPSLPEASVIGTRSRARPENRETDFDRTATTRLAHDFSRIPVHPESPFWIQAKLAVNAPGDIYEQEADRVAEQVMRMPEPQVESACACGGACPKCQAEQTGHGEARLQTKRAGSGHRGQTEAPAIVGEVLRSPGQPIDPAIRASMESRFGHDFSRVRVHTDELAARSVQSIDAIAYTAGNHIAFGANRYQPRTSSGLGLFAHELTHVVQQTNAAAPAVQRQPLPGFPAKGIKVIGPDADELVKILSSCTGTQLTLDKSKILSDSGKKASSSHVSGFAHKQLASLIKDPNGIILDTDPSVPGMQGGSFSPAQPGLQHVNVQHMKVMTSASGVSGGSEICSAVIHEISEAANGRALGVQGKTPQPDLLRLSHEYGVDIENKIRADFKLPLRNKTGSMVVTFLNVTDKSFVLTLTANTFGAGSDIRTQLDVIKTPYVMANNRAQPLANEVLASQVEAGTVALDTKEKARRVFERVFDKLRTQLDLP
jgi:hypothetical protein